MKFRMIGIRKALVLAGALLVLAPISGLSSGPAKHTTTSTPTAEQSSPAAVLGQVSSVVKSQQPAAIPLANVATQAATEMVFLESISPLGNADVDAQAVERQFPALSAIVDRDQPELKKLLQGAVSLGLLQEQEQLWQSRQLQLTQWQSTLVNRAEQLQTVLNHLNLMQKSWDLTAGAAQAGNAPPQIIQQISSMSAAISKAAPRVEARRGTVLVLQEFIAEKLTTCAKALVLVRKLQKTSVGSILVQDSPPIWGLGALDHSEEGVSDRLRVFFEHSRSEFSGFFSIDSPSFILLLGIFAVLTILFGLSRRLINDWKDIQEFSAHTDIFASPLIAALAVACFMGSSPMLNTPLAVRGVMSLLTILPMILMVQTILNKRPLPVLYIIGVLFILDTFRQLLAGIPLVEQCLLMFEALSGIGLMFWWRWYSAAGGSSVIHEAVPFILRVEKRVSVLIILVELASCCALLFGYLRLARLLVSGVLVAAVMAMVLFVFIRMTNGLVAVGFRTWPLKQLRMVSDYRALLEQRINTVLIWGACIVWLERALDYVGLLNPVLEFGRHLLGVKLQRASISVSIGEIVAFVITLWLTFLLASFTGFVLRNDVFPRSKITEGVSYAFSSLLRYLLIVTGFVIALGEIGLTVNRMIIIISAFSVGIGFGLQNIVSNFLSGLILLFERPLHVGDTIEFGSNIGNVWQIGIRSSKVRTFSGADIIVPNSDLVTEQVTNWTYSDRQRRIDLPLGVNYGADPQQVIDLLQEVAHQHPDILDSPAAVCFMTGYGESCINFELRAWTDHSLNWFQIRSDLAVAIYKAVTAAGMSFPFPQREIRLVGSPETGTVKPAQPSEP
jgi:small-conductance mechanosensitive channel